MRLSESVEKSGFFWIPGEPEKQLPGILRISESGEVTVEVSYVYHVGLLLLDKRPFGYPPETSEEWALNHIDRIVGIVGKDSVTLDECSYDPVDYSKVIGGGGVSYSKIRADRAFIGFDGQEERGVSFSKVLFFVEGLEEWLSISGFRSERDTISRGESIRYIPPEDMVLSVSNGLELRLKFEWKSSTSFSHVRVRQLVCIALLTDELQPFEYYEKQIRKVHNFVRFVTDEIVSIKEIIGYSSEITRNDSGEKGHEVPIYVYYRRLPHLDAKPNVNRSGMLLPYQYVTDQLEHILANWLQCHEDFEPVFNLYFASRSGTRMFLESIFLSLVQGLESLHRRTSQERYIEKTQFGKLIKEVKKLIEQNLTDIPKDVRDILASKLNFLNELVLRDRFKRLIEPFEEFFVGANGLENFISQVANTRNYLTHYDDALVSRAASGEALWELSMKLEALFQLQILRLLGVDNELIKLIVYKNYALKDKLGLKSKIPSNEATPLCQHE